MATVVHGDFEWDDAKAMANLAKHGVSFEEAATAVVDPRALFIREDSAGGRPNDRYRNVRTSRVLFVVHIVRGERDRIISARLATRTEEALYEQDS